MEDSKTSLMVMGTYFADTPYQLNIADGRKTGLDKFITGSYDLVFIDMEMPTMKRIYGNAINQKMGTRAGSMLCANHRPHRTFLERRNTTMLRYWLPRYFNEPGN